MKTKTSILAALFAFAGGASLMAQVYSVNVVGYVNVTVPTGFSMIANQLDTTDKKISTLLPWGSVPPGTTVWKWNGTTLVSRYMDDLDQAWAPDGNLTVGPGDGLFINNTSGSTFTITFVGEVLQGTQTNAMSAGFNIVSSKVPQAGAVNTLGFPEVGGATIWKYVNNGSGGGGYVSAYYDDLDLAWNPAPPTVGVGESFWAKMPSNANWTRTFNVN